jgi:phosphonate transport system substrate-binding protein
MRKLVFGLGPSAAGPKHSDFRGGFADLLGQALDAHVQVFAAESYFELLGRIEADEVHLAWLPPATFVKARDKHEVTLLASNVRFGEATYHGVLFGREGGIYQDLDSLRGATVAWVDPDSCGGYLFPRFALIERGLVPEKVFATEVMLGTHGNVIDAVASQEIDLGATYVHLASGHEGEQEALVSTGWTDARCTIQMRTLLTSRTIPNDVICTTSDVGIGFEKRILTVLTNLHATDEGRRVLDGLFQSVRFEPANLRDYDVVRAALNVAKTEKSLRPRLRRR